MRAALSLSNILHSNSSFDATSVGMLLFPPGIQVHLIQCGDDTCQRFEEKIINDCQNRGPLTALVFCNLDVSLLGKQLGKEYNIFGTEQVQQ